MMRGLCAHELERVSGGEVAYLPAYVFQTGGFAPILQGTVNNVAGVTAAEASEPPALSACAARKLLCC